MHSYGRIPGEEALLTLLLHGLHVKDLFPTTNSVTGGRTRKGRDTRPLSITCGAALLRWRGLAQGVYWRPAPASRLNGVDVNMFRGQFKNPLVVERTHSWLHNFRRLRIRFDRRADIHEAFLKFGCALLCWNIQTSGLDGIVGGKYG